MQPLTPLRGDSLFKVDGESMAPFLVPGDLVRVRPCGVSELRRGDLVVVGDAVPVLHRLLRLNARSGKIFLKTKGDNRFLPDPERSAGELRGRAVAVFRRAGETVEERSLVSRWNRLAACLSGLEGTCWSFVRAVRSLSGRRGMVV